MSDDAINRLIDLFEEQALAFLAHPEAAPAVRARLQRLVPPAPPPETPERLVLVKALTALRTAQRRAHVRDKPQISGAISEIRRVLGIAPEEPSTPPALAPVREHAPDAVPSAGDPVPAAARRGSAADSDRLVAAERNRAA